MFALGVGPTLAQAIKQLGTYQSWSAYSASQGSDAICFAMTQASGVTPTPDGYSQGYLYLTNRPAQKITNELNLIAGFDFASDSEATLSVGGRSYALFTRNDAAWLKDVSQSDNLAGIMRAGTSVVVEGTSDKGVKVTETFSLSGATAASHALDKAC